MSTGEGSGKIERRPNHLQTVAVRSTPCLSLRQPIVCGGTGKLVARCRDLFNAWCEMASVSVRF